MIDVTFVARASSKFLFLKKKNRLPSSNIAKVNAFYTKNQFKSWLAAGNTREGEPSTAILKIFSADQNGVTYFNRVCPRGQCISSTCSLLNSVKRYLYAAFGMAIPVNCYIHAFVTLLSGKILKLLYGRF